MTPPRPINADVTVASKKTSVSHAQGSVKLAASRPASVRVPIPGKSSPKGAGSPTISGPLVQKSVYPEGTLEGLISRRRVVCQRIALGSRGPAAMERHCGLADGRDGLSAYGAVKFFDPKETSALHAPPVWESAV